MNVLVRVNSHRARHRLERLLGDDRLQSWFTFAEGGQFVEIPTNRLDEARQIPGITKARPKGELFRCWGAS